MRRLLSGHPKIMDLDLLLKRAFPAVLCLLIGTIAYYQASAMGALVVSAISGASPASPPRVQRAPRTYRKPASGAPILKRNPFDSVTGPLDGSSVEIAPAESMSSAEAVSGDAPRCGFGRVLLIARSDDAQWSFAAIEGGSEGSQLRRIGDKVQQHKLQELAWNTVWLEKDGSRCHMKVGDKAKSSSRKTAKKKKKKKSSRRSRRSTKLPPELKAKIHKVTDTEYNIERSVVDAILERQAEFMKNTRMRPVKDGDKVVGLKVSRIRRGSLFDVLGVRNGDQLQAINGFELTNPQKALEAYGRLRTADRLSLRVVRGGKPTTLEFNIQ